MWSHHEGQYVKFLQKGIAFLPVNLLNEGDHLKVLMGNGTEEIWTTQVEGFLKRLVYYLGGDVKALRKQYGQAVGRKQLIPLPLSAEQVLIPFRTRIPIGEQSSYGWVVAKAILDVCSAENLQTEIKLCGGHSLRVYQSLNFCQAQLRNAQLVRHRYLQLHPYEQTERFRGEWGGAAH